MVDSLSRKEREALGLPEWLHSDNQGHYVSWNDEHDTLTLQGFSASDVSRIPGAIIKSTFADGIVKSAWLPLSSEALARTESILNKGTQQDDYAAYGAAMNAGKEAYTQMESDGWTPVMPDPIIAAERLGKSPLDNTTQTQTTPTVSLDPIAQSLLPNPWDIDAQIIASAVPAEDQSIWHNVLDNITGVASDAYTWLRQHGEPITSGLGAAEDLPAAAINMTDWLRQHGEPITSGLGAAYDTLSAIDDIAGKNNDSVSYTDKIHNIASGSASIWNQIKTPIYIVAGLFGFKLISDFFK